MSVTILPAVFGSCLKTDHFVPFQRRTLASLDDSSTAQMSFRLSAALVLMSPVRPAGSPMALL
jgi:hypothetical protein